MLLWVRKEVKNKMLLCKTIDLDLEEPNKVYQDAQETIAYLQDVVKSIEERVIAGEALEGFDLIESPKRRTITENGYKYLEHTLGHDVVYKTIEKPIGVTELERILTKDDFAALYGKGVVVFEPGKPRVILKK